MRLRQRRVFAGAVVAVSIGVAAAILVSDREPERAVSASTGGGAAIRAAATLSPRTVLFGDTVRGHIDVVLDKSRVDPESVRVAADPAPFEIVGPPNVRRQDFGHTVVLRTTLVLRCATANCVPSGQSVTYDFAPVRISFAGESEEAADRSSTMARFPSIRVYSRFAALSSPTIRPSAPWQADLVSLPPVSYRLDRGLLVALLLGGASVAGLAALVLAYHAWPRRVSAPTPEPELEPEPALSPLEQALALLDTAILTDGAPGQRRALELVAEELERGEWGDRQLAGVARSLAWSEAVPAVEEVRRVAATVRDALPQDDEHLGNGGGGVG